jgi:histidinol phosphatase-like enzyme
MMNKFLKEMEARSARSKMIYDALREYEAAVKNDGEFAYARLAGFLEANLIPLAADRLDSTEELVRNLKFATSRVGSV